MYIGRPIFSEFLRPRAKVFLVQALRQFLAGLEFSHVLGSDLNHFASTWVFALTSRTVVYRKSAEADQAYAVTSLKRTRYTV